MSNTDILRSEFGTKLFLAAPHVQLEAPIFYKNWALHAVENGMASPSLVQLAILEVDLSADEIARLARKASLEVFGLDVSREQAVALVILEALSVLSSDTQSCWQELQKLRQLTGVPEAFKPLYREIEMLDLELGRAGEKEALFQTVAEGVLRIKRAANSFVEHSTLRIGAKENLPWLDLRIPPTLVRFL